MSISMEYALEHKKEPAVLCCRAEENTVIDEHNLEDPAIFADLVDSGLLDLDGAVTIEQALGATLVGTYDSLTALTADKLSGIKDVVNDEETVNETVESIVPANSVATGAPAAMYGNITIDIGEGKDIHLEIPISVGCAAPAGGTAISMPRANETEVAKDAKVTDEAEDMVVLHSMKNYTFPVKNVVVGDETTFKDGVLTIRESLVKEAVVANPLVRDVKLDIIRPDKTDVFTNTIMDVQPIAVKKEGIIGHGITFEMTGVYAIVTGTDEAGIQVAEANVSGGVSGTYDQIVEFDRPGSPDKDAFIVRCDVVIKEGTGMERPGPLAAHQAADVIVQEIREVLKKMNIENAAEERTYEEIEHKDAARVVIVHEIMGQGAMHDNLILPDEPCGFIGGRPNVDLGNVPVFLTTNEVRDGGIHALTCITPDTKETSLFYWRDPYVKRVVDDPELNLVGIIFVGSPQENTAKAYVSKRVGAMTESMKVDGAIVITEGFGNNHIDFAQHIEEIGKRGIPVVGCSYCGVQGALVVGNKYMDAMVDHCVTSHGNCEDILQLNTGTPATAKRAVALLKNKIADKKIESAPRRYDMDRIEKNEKAIDEVYGNDN